MPNKQQPEDDGDPSTLYLCGTCHTAVDWAQKAILCDVCEVWYHIDCHNIQSTDYSNLGHTSVEWLCANCCCEEDPVDSESHMSSQSHGSSSIISIPSLDNEAEPRHTSSPMKPKPKWTRGKPLKIINVNCQSLSGKKGAWLNLLDSCKPDIVIATETWLDSSIKTNELELDHYSVYRRDRKTGRGGGILIAVAEAAKSSAIATDTTSEILWVKVACKGQRDLLVGACYRPQVSDQGTIPELFSTIETLSQKRSCDIFLGGDFNFPGWDWKSLSLKPNCSHPKLHHEFLTATNDYKLTQLVTDNTRAKNTLDLMLTNIPFKVNRTIVVPGISDHEIPVVELSTKARLNRQIQREILLYRKADWTGLKEHLQNSVSHLAESEGTPQELWTKLKQHLNEASKKFIPTRSTKRKDSCPWITPYLKQLMTKRDALYEKSKKYGLPNIEARFREHKKKCQCLLRREHNQYVHNLFTDPAESATSLNKRFWTYVKHRRSEPSGITAIKSANKLLTDPKSMADALNRQFHSVFSAPEASPPPSGVRVHGLPTMEGLRIDTDGVLKLLKELNPNKATGPDGISPRLLKEAADIVAAPLRNIFQKSLQTSSVPDDWRRANVTPIFKKGDKYKPENYRPISLTCIASKMLEHIVTSHIMKFIEGNKLLHPKQHGFRANLSCETQLVELVSDISAELDKGKEVDACVLDFSKAFDKVCHAKLIHKMTSMGISKQLADWTTSFLKDRSQVVTIQGTNSTSCPVTSGVPQGSVIGPALFLLYINDLPAAVKSRVRLFADDTVIYATTDKSDQLQADLGGLEEWERSWNMEFHPAKCEFIRFSRKKTKTHTPTYLLHQEAIPQVHTTKYLGVKIQSDLKWNSHIEYITTKASTSLGLMKRTIPSQSVDLRTKAYKQLIRPVLEYGSCSWDPLTKTLAAQVEAVQRRSARAVFGIPRSSRTSTTGLLQRLGWEALEERRRHRRICMFRAMHYSEIRTQISDYTRRSESRTSTRRHDQQYAVEHHKTKAHMSTFFVQTSKDWNCLGKGDRLLCPPDPG